MGIYTNLAQILSKSISLPVFVFPLTALPETRRNSPKTAASFLYGQNMLEQIARASGQHGTAQYLKSKYLECFVFMPLAPDYEVWIGPLLTHAMSEGKVADLIRREKLPIRKKSELAEYYNRLPVLSEDQYFYIGQLAEILFAESRPSEPPPTLKREEDAAPVFAVRRESESRLEMFEHPPYFMELEMTRLVMTGDLDSALQAMDKINTFNRAVLAKEPLRSLKNSLICDCTFLARAAISGGVSPDDAFALSDALILQIEETSSIKALEKLEQQHLITFVELVHSYNAAHFSKPVRDIIGYINGHLSEKLELPLLAETVFMHPNYLSSLFKKETGIPLNRYILQRRIEEAKFFLRYSENSVSDIATFYQFSSQSYFIRRFAELEGVTPLQYRKASAAKSTLPLPSSG